MLFFFFRDGTGPAGLFAIVHNALQQLRLDEEVDIFNTVMQIQSRRPDVIASLVDILQCSFTRQFFYIMLIKNKNKNCATKAVNNRAIYLSTKATHFFEESFGFFFSFGQMKMKFDFKFVNFQCVVHLN